ncbi:tetratricopeptide repeat protein [Myxococcus sp. Y35]|uniref:tetratricopeptide repeat protein n=1 Tax=Pseudomyxococcus flavus TaxID=3115648 RepID=UPI003CF66C17
MVLSPVMGNPLLKGSPIRGWLLSCTLLLPGLALGQQPAARTVTAREHGSAFRSRLNAAAQLYEELEYEQALIAIGKAKALASTGDERAEASVYEGIILADLGKRPQSLKAFHNALSLRPDARLPVKVSPKVERDFESVRSKVQSESLAILAPEANQSMGSGAGDRPLLTPEQHATVTPTSTPSSEPAHLAGLPDASRVDEKAGFRVRPLPMALLGAGVLAGGLGSYFGLRSRSSIQSARDAIYVTEKSRHLDSAQGQALGANILFGIAATAAAGAVITWFLGDEDASERGTP